MKEPFEIWWEENMGGFGVSTELKNLLSKAFTGGMEASSGMKSVPIRKMSLPALERHIAMAGLDTHKVGEPEIIAVWPMPPSMAVDEALRHIPPPVEKPKSFMGDIRWGDPVPIVPSTTTYDPSSDTWHTRTVGDGSHYVGGGGGSGGGLGVGFGGGVLTTSTVGAEVWNTAETYADMSREEREREMAVIADMLKKKIDESVLEKFGASVGMTTGGMTTGLIPPKHLYDHRDFVTSMSHPKKILTDEQRKTLAMKKKEMSDHINKLAKKHKARK